MSVCASLILLCGNELTALQGRDHRLRKVDLALVAGAAGMFAAPHLFSINDHPPSCAPCDRQTVPWVDRWAIAEPRDPLHVASTVLVVSLAAAAAVDLSRPGPAHYGDVAYVAESAGWAVGAAELIKAAVARKRPVLYTGEAAAAVDDLDAQRSWPSSHAALAFALATSYLLAPSERPATGWRKWAALGGAAAVGTLRVAAGRHFPSDVVGGAALGVVSAVTVRAIRF